jgi:hypothetical protein
MIIRITPSQFIELEKRYGLNVVFMLKCTEKQIDLVNGAKLSALMQSVIRKGLLNQSGNSLTTIGRELLSQVNIEWEEGDEDIPLEEKKIILNKSKSEDFENFWKIFPGSDSFTYKGREFCGCRTLRVNREECRIKFDKILLEGEYTANDLTQALSLDIFRKKEQSVRNGENKLTYMKASLTYLNQRAYEPLIEDIRNGAKIDTQNNTFDGFNI